MRRDVFQAIADPTRREIINLIAYQSLTPNSVADNFDLSRQAISKHMQILTECGLLKLDIQGREYYYTIQPKKFEEVYEWLEPLRELWETRFNQLDELLKKDITKKKKNYDNNKKNKSDKRRS